MAPKSKYSNMQKKNFFFWNTVSLSMCGLTSQKIPMMQRILQLFTVKGIWSIVLGDIH